MLKKLLLTTALLAGMTAAAQQAEGQFSIATLDVDGQPQKVLFFHLNDDGPGSAGTVRIGQYLAKRDYDLVFTQEDFNYHDELTVLLEDNYQFDTWSGSVGLDEQQIDYLHLQNHRYACDGLGACIKQGIAVGLAERTPWLHTFGKFSHAHDELVTKGFRRYELTLSSGDELVVYNMHCDGSDPVDERSGNDQRDRQARLNEWIQLRDDILSRIDERPVIVVGHTASYYQRDDIHAQFIEAINASGRATAADVWVELQHEGIYPQLSGPRRASFFEILDQLNSILAKVDLTLSDFIEMLEDSGISLMDLMQVYDYLTTAPATDDETAGAGSNAQLSLFNRATDSPAMLLRQYQQTLAAWLLMGGIDVEYSKWGW